MATPGNTLPRGLPEATTALKAAQSASSLAALIMVFGFSQLCCLGTPMLEAGGGVGSWRGIAMFVAAGLSSFGGLLVLPCSSSLTRGIGGTKGGPQFKNFEARIAGGTAARPELLPRIFRYGLYGSLLVASGELTVLLATLGTGRNIVVLVGLTAVMLIISLGSAVAFAGGHARHADTLRRLPLPLPAPPGTFPEKGSLESVAIWFGSNARSVCGLACGVGTIEFIVMATMGIVGEPEMFAALPITGFATVACYKGWNNVDIGLRTRDERIRTGLQWGLAGGIAGTLPMVIGAVIALGENYGGWYRPLDGLTPPVRAALGQPMGFCFSLFVLPLVLCGVALGVFGRELATRRSNEERLIQGQSRGDL